MSSVTPMQHTEIRVSATCADDTYDVRLYSADIEHSVPAYGGRLHLGSQDLIRFANFAMQEGYDILKFTIGDSLLDPLEPLEQQEVSDRAIRMLTAYGENELEEELMRTLGYYVVGVELFSPFSKTSALVLRGGRIVTAAQEDTVGLLNRAKKELRLS